MQLSVLVTGANGFVGSTVCKGARERGIHVREAVRHAASAHAGVDVCLVSDLSADTQWSHALQGVHVVVHCAARVHVMSDKAADPLADFRRINVDGTLNLARQAAASGVRRFVFISSVKVNGEATAKGRAFSSGDQSQPQDPYGISKMEAEQGLHKVAADTGMQVVIIRPALVYGPGVKANFATLMGAVQRSLPLPLGAINNQRSVLALDNLVDLIITCMTHAAAANQIFMASDEQDVSTPELVRHMALALGKPARLVSVPVWLLKAIGYSTGRSKAVERLCGNLQVDLTKTRQVLGWRPKLTLDQGLQQVARAMARK